MSSYGAHGGRGWRGSRPFIGSTPSAPTGRGRGGFAPRGGRGALGHSWGKRKPQNVPDTSLHPLGKLLTTFNNSHLDMVVGSSSDVASIANCKYVASYNWLNERTPTIIVPGKPPLWTPLKEPQRLKEDKGEYFRDPNAARFPRYPTEPAVQAILKSDTDFPTLSIDIFACGSTMGNLLRFVRFIDKPFRFHVEVVGNTVFFVRKENAPKELIPDVRGFGHSFPESYTTWERDVGGSETHQRLVEYVFAGLKCLIRFGCDGYHGNLASRSVTGNPAPDMASDPVDLIEALEATLVGETLSDPDNSLNVRTGGTQVPQQSIFDLKTRSGRFGSEIDMEDIIPLLWIRQIPNFIVAYHDGAGLFQDIKVKDVQKDVRDWETENQTALKRLEVLLHKIIEFAKADGEGLVEVYCPSVDQLEIRKRFGDGSEALPPSLKSRWEGLSHEVDAEKSKTGIHSLYDYDEKDGSGDFTACSEECGYCGQCS
ncbi:hypothetical protein K469DRAFT_683604 [Zopfia rhizophila CBS 207.26]|uniref:Geranylgeranyl pyrophosphate synthetase n=1 Tax=Zopfia rhizophila CBS 207.26 TaxID=1314779 RepID=A0A6A6EH07_9PEZI|nr:hypothetical protein K469DRAFT_683604 [Zopfia rhizophila CBS 207.26]